MSELEDEVKDLREKNNELVKKVQYWKMTAAQRENEKLDLMKEMNELRLKLSRLRSGGAAHARKLDSALQTASEEVLSHLVQASSAVAHMLELNKTYTQDRQELETALPRWSNLSNTPSSDKVNRVPPMLIGGRLIQPVVTLSRTLQSNSARPTARSPNQQNRSASERAVPMHMLQDVYIPLTRIDAAPVVHSPRRDSAGDTPPEDSDERISEEPQNMSDDDELDESRRLEAVIEDAEPETQTPQRPTQDNPLEGPSWLLDEPTRKRRSKSLKSLTNSEPDSTTEVEELHGHTHPQQSAAVCVFTPTVRRRRRSPAAPASPAAAPATPPPQYSPRPARRLSNNGRVLKVLVAKMCLEEEDLTGGASPPKRPNVDDGSKNKVPKERSPKRKATANRSQSPATRDLSPAKGRMRFDAPSPNGSTDSRVIVSETKTKNGESDAEQNETTRDSGESSLIFTAGDANHNQSGENKNESKAQRLVSSCDSRARGSRENRDSDSSGSEMAEGRTRRPRKAVVYKEKPLNRKLRR